MISVSQRTQARLNLLKVLHFKNCGLADKFLGLIRGLFQPDVSEVLELLQQLFRLNPLNYSSFRVSQFVSRR